MILRSAEVFLFVDLFALFFGLLYAEQTADTTRSNPISV